MSVLISRSFEDIKVNSFLQFISAKHKIPLKTITKAPKLQSGYVPFCLTQREADIRKVHKYQTNSSSMPPMGLAFDADAKDPDEEDEVRLRRPPITADILKEEEDCFQ